MQLFFKANTFVDCYATNHWSSMSKSSYILMERGYSLGKIYWIE